MQALFSSHDDFLVSKHGNYFQRQIVNGSWWITSTNTFRKNMLSCILASISRQSYVHFHWDIHESISFLEHLQHINVLKLSCCVYLVNKRQRIMSNSLSSCYLKHIFCFLLVIFRHNHYILYMFSFFSFF
jgi:hypothetical protein